MMSALALFLLVPAVTANAQWRRDDNRQRQEQRRREREEWRRRQQQSQAPVFGVVLNQVDLRKARKYGHGHSRSFYDYDFAPR
jgi:hypothetical protein